VGPWPCGGIIFPCVRKALEGVGPRKIGVPGHATHCHFHAAPAIGLSCSAAADTWTVGDGAVKNSDGGHTL